MEKKRLNNEGFSLIELIIVIAIMAILVGALAPQFIKYLDRARQGNDVQAVGALYTAVQTACADPDLDNPTGLTAGVTVMTNGACDTTSLTGLFWDEVGGVVGGFGSFKLTSDEYKTAKIEVKYASANAGVKLRLTGATKKIVIDSHGSKTYGVTETTDGY